MTYLFDILKLISKLSTLKGLRLACIPPHRTPFEEVYFIFDSDLSYKFPIGFLSVIKY